MRALVVCWLFFLQLRSFVGASPEFLICCLLVVFCSCWLLFLCVLAFFVVCWLFLCSVGASSELHRSFFLLFVGCFLLLLAVFCWFYVFCCLNVVFFGSVGASSDLYQSFCSSMFFFVCTANHPQPPHAAYLSWRGRDGRVSAERHVDCAASTPRCATTTSPPHSRRLARHHASGYICFPQCQFTPYCSTYTE